jgi:hypothetical protein
MYSAWLAIFAPDAVTLSPTLKLLTPSPTPITTPLAE